MSLELISAIIYTVYLFWKTAVFPCLVIILCVIAIVAYALQYELFQKIKAFFIKTPSIEFSAKDAEPVDTAILNDSLYHYQQLKCDKRLINWIHKHIILYKENECIELNELKQHLEDAKYRANHLDRSDIATIIFNFENDLIELEYDSNGILPKDRLNTLIADLEFNLNIQLYKPDQFLNRIKQTFPNFLDIAKSSPLYRKPKHDVAAFSVFIIENFHQHKRVQLQHAFELIESLLIEEQTLEKRALIVEFFLELIQLADSKFFQKIPAYLLPQTKIIFDNLLENWYYYYDEEFSD